MAIDCAVGGRLRKLRPEEAWATIKKLAQYEDEGWNDLVDPNEGSLDHENSDIEKLLGIIERKFDTLMKDVISLMRRGRELARRLKDKIREEGSIMREIEKITKYPDMEVSEPLARHKFPETPTKNTFPDALKSIPINSLGIRCVQLNFSDPHRDKDCTLTRVSEINTTDDADYKGGLRR
ncbi:hypothetical protein Tco_0921498 [Tanacetum coccineum]